MAYYMSYSLCLIFLTVKNSCKILSKNKAHRVYQQVEKTISWEEKGQIRKKTPNVNILEQWFLNCGPWIIILIWEFVGNASAQAPL